MLAGELGPLFLCCSTGVTGVGVRTSAGGLFSPVFRMHMVPWWSNSVAPVWPVASVTQSSQHGHLATQSSCPPQDHSSRGSHTALFVSCGLPVRDTCCRPPTSQVLHPTLCPRAGHQLCLMYLPGLHRGASCLLRTANQLWPGRPLLCHPAGLAIPSLMMSLKPILGENLNRGEMFLFQDYLSLHNVPQSQGTI